MFLAEKAGFEPALRYYPKHAFQACDLNRSSTSPKVAQDKPERALSQSKIVSEIIFPSAQSSKDAGFVGLFYLCHAQCGGDDAWLSAA